MVANRFMPRYQQLKELIREHVAKGEWRPGDLIPSERELSERFGVSRMTARQAITEVTNDGLLYRQQGKGTFVAWPKIAQQLSALTGFSADIQARGQRPGARVIEAQMVAVEPHAAIRLHIRPGQRAFRLYRVRLADAEPLALERVLISFFGCERLLDEDLAANSLYQLLETRYGLPPVEAEQEIEAGLASEDDAQLLGIAPGSPVLLLRRTTYTTGHQPIEYAESVYRGDKYTFQVRLQRSAGTL
ncbi:MAG: GntR family transcriptional regulator [Thermomicrobiales bacterium]